MEQAIDGIFIADANGNYIDVNSQGCALLGFSREEILQLNLRDVLLPEDVSITPLRTPELYAGQTVLSERRMRRKDGSIFPAEISVKRLADGRLQGIVRDITERRWIEETLKASELRFRTAAESLTDIIYEWDLKEAITWYGDIDGLMGYPPGEFPGR